MEKIIPFYMAYPLSLYFDQEENSDKDFVTKKELI